MSQQLVGDMEHGEFACLITGLLSDAMCSEKLNRTQVWSCRAWIVQPENISELLLLGSLEILP